MNRTFSLLTFIAISLLSASSFAQTNQSDTGSASAQTASSNEKKDERKQDAANTPKSSSDKGEENDSESSASSSNSDGFGQLKLNGPFNSSANTTSDESEKSSENSDGSDNSDEGGEESQQNTTSESAPTPDESVVSVTAEAAPSGEVLETEGISDFEPLPDVEEGALELILPGKIHPRIDFKGYFRARVDMPVNYDLDTNGTSAVLPVLDSVGTPVPVPDKSVAISSNMRLHIEPTLVITDELSVHSEFDILDNVVFGDSPVRDLQLRSYRPELYSPLTNSSQFSVSDSIKIRQLYGQIDSLFGSLMIGRMDNNFGLGIQDNDGNGIDGDFGSNVDSVKVMTHIFGLTASASLDFPDEGISTWQANGPGGVAYDLAQVDDADQYTFQIAYAPSTEQEKLLEQRTLKHDGIPIVNAALQFRYRTQDGMYSTSPTATFPNALPTLVYKGLNVYSFDVWAKMIHNPNDDLFIRLEFEAFTNFGSIDNVSDKPVGQASGNTPAVNCFKDGTKEPRCSQDLEGTALAREFVQWGFALESEFRIGQLASWGLNLGVASGGKTPNWGTSGKLPDYDFAQFNRDYHVDLILFRNIIGTVTNAAYFKPYVHFDFLRAGSRHLEGEVSSILSFAVNKEGTPSGNRGLGAEFDGALRYILKDQLSAGFEAGVLFPFSGLDAVQGRPRYLRYQSKTNIFTEPYPAKIAWTLQGKFVWMF